MSDGKVKVRDEDVVKHWGLKEDGSWMLTGDGVIIAFTCPRVANVQKDIYDMLYKSMEDDAVITVEEIK